MKGDQPQDWESLSIPTNVGIANHLRAGGRIMMEFEPGIWLDNPCGCIDPEGWEVGYGPTPRPVAPVAHYRLAPL